MPKVDPTTYLLDALSILTGGLIKDMQTLILGLVVCAFILMAFDLLKDLILLPALQSAASFLADPVGNYRTYQINKRITADNPTDDPIYEFTSQRDGVELSEERYADLESAMDEAVYNDRMKNRLSDDEAYDLVNSHSERLR
ncbi:MAG: hypothetical protein PHI97_31290 [Desulfobulbus sp.]|nr:hypothetical protein [Desulfobulbus sp.]